VPDDQVTCPQCGQPVPDTPFCVRCGESLRGSGGPAGRGRRDSYAAAPGQSVARVAMFSTLLPQLPDADLDAFRLAFAGGFVALVALVVVGAFPVALVGAAVLVPALVLVYVYSVDVYEDTPLPVIAMTMLWGVVTGSIFGIVTAGLLGTGSRFGGIELRDVLLLGVVVPLAGTVVMIAGPLLLLRDRRFNDVVDGATFGVASAVTFVGAQVVAGSIDLFAAGLFPPGEPLPWITRIVTIAVALPVVAAGAIGSAVGAVWLRYRSPVRDRAALGTAGRPIIAVILAAALLVAAALATYLPGPILNVVAQLALAAVALLWLRRTLHVGLLQEAFEIEIGDEFTCANCGVATRRHSFCGNCGISLHALPKGQSRAEAPAPPPTEDAIAAAGQSSPPAASPAPPAPRSAVGDAGSRLNQRGVLMGFAVVLGAIVLIAAIAAVLSDAPEPPPDCQPGTECGGPPPAAEASEPPERPSAVPPGTVGIRAGIPVINSELGYQFEYSDWWAIDPSVNDPREVDLIYQGTSGDGILIVAAVPSNEASVQAYAAQWTNLLRDWAPDLQADDSEKNAILGPSIGFVDGVGVTFAGSRSSPQSATTPVGISLLVASDGRTTAAVTLIVFNPDKPVGSKWLQYNIRSRAELILKTFRWTAPP
jgi:hypothetical protein